MNTTDLIILEQLLIKYLVFAEAADEISIIKPCLKLVKTKLELIQEGYILDENEKPKR